MCVARVGDQGAGRGAGGKESRWVQGGHGGPWGPQDQALGAWKGSSRGARGACPIHAASQVCAHTPTGSPRKRVHPCLPTQAPTCTHTLPPETPTYAPHGHRPTSKTPYPNTHPPHRHPPTAGRRTWCPERAHNLLEVMTGYPHPRPCPWPSGASGGDGHGSQIQLGH